MSEPTTSVETFRIPALDCPDEFHLIRKGLEGRTGIGTLVPDYLNRTLRIQFDSQHLDAQHVAEEIRRLGFQVEWPSGDPTLEQDASVLTPRITTVLGGGLLAVAATTRLAMGETSTGIAAIAATSAIVSGIPVAQAAVRALRLRSLDMNALMTIAIVGALATAEFFEAATAMFLFGISLWLERLSMGRARRAVQSLVALAPIVAHRITSQRRQPTHPPPETSNASSPSKLMVEPSKQAWVEDVDPGLLEVGDRVLAKPGERIPVDGTVLAGSSAVNQAPITGESIPVEKVPDDPVYAGTLNGEGSLEVRVDRPAQKSTLAHITRLVGQAQVARSPTQRFVDRFAQYYTPIVIGMAALLALLPPLLAQIDVAWAAAVDPWQWLHRGLVLLVIACPCALVLSTPITIVCGVYHAARRGMLIKGGQHLESAGKIDCMALDKTGTLTDGIAQVVDVEPSHGFTDEDVLAIAAALEHHSEHPLAAAIVTAARQRGLSIRPVDKFVTRRGLGVQGSIDGKMYYVGSPRYIQEKQLGGQRQDGAQTRGNDSDTTTAAVVATDDKLVGMIRLADRIRDGAAQSIHELKRLGIDPIWILTGDRHPAARRIADELGVEHVLDELLPEDKVACVEKLTLQYPNLAMVGDGVNDAPALATAQLGIALGSQSSDTALETADIVVMSPELARLPELVRLGRRCRRLLTQNISLALGAKATVLVLASLGYANMWMAVAADVGASLVVIANGMRLIRGE